MLNSLQNSVFDADEAASSEFIASGNSLRLNAIGLLFLAAVIVILARVYWVQTRLPDEYLAALQVTSSEDELLPARDGRILADSIVLASDVDVYSVEVHYRWLQHAINPQWMRLQIRQRLSREERRDAALVMRVEDQIRAERAALRDALANATRTPPAELTARFSKVEERVQRVSDAVNRRLTEPVLADSDDETDDDSGLLLSIATSVRTALTTPPTRTEEDRIVVREEETCHRILDDVGLDVAALINEHPETFPGVRVTRSARRTYPENTLAAHVVGVRTNVRDADLSGDKSDDLTLADLTNSSAQVGRSGVERSYDHQLLGVAGIRRTIRNRRQQVISSEIIRHPVSGRDVTLTLDTRLQQLSEQLLAESLGDAPRLLLPATQAGDDPTVDTAAADSQPTPVGGCILVMEADSGRLIAAASAPTFDLWMFVDGSQDMWKAVNSDTRRPFVPRFTGMALPPGSTFKIVTAIAALESGVITPDAPFECHGYLTNPDEHRCMIYRLFGATHGRVKLRTAMAQSCNVYFFDAARRMGIEPLVHWSDQLEFGRATGIDLPYERTGSVPSAGTSSATASTEAGQRRFEREALGLSIGQSRLTVTPLQMARLLAFVANDGWLVTPHVVSDDGTARRTSDIDHSPYRVTRHRIPDISTETLNAVRAGLQAVVEEPLGTGFKTVRLPDILIAGKTGTAETAPGKPDHAWFTGYFPADKPQYVIVVVLEHGGSGSKAAGPIAREVVRSMAERRMLDDSKTSAKPE
jgi:penicillin-binding protein 2